MKQIKSIILLLLLLGPLTATVARADHWHGTGFHGARWGWGVGVGLGVGLALDPLLYPYGYYPYSYYPGYYYPPVVAAQQAAPTAYVEQAAPVQGYAPPAASQAAPSNDWYYCRQPQGYYPYVRACPDGWQRVPSQPPQH